MAICISRFEKEKAVGGHNNTILASPVMPDGLKTPFDHAYGYLENGNMMEAHSHPTAEVYIVYSGKGWVVVGDDKQEVYPGDVINIPPNESHTMIAQENGTFLWAALWWEPIE